MGESERRRKYRYGRVLIETERILNPQFNSAFLYVTGAQLELLRNVTQYLGMLHTYVSEYQPGYYLTPTAGDYDSLLAIVADLENILMAAENAPWKITDNVRYSELSENADAGYNSIAFASVPADEIWIVQGLQAKDEDNAIDRIELGAQVKGNFCQLQKYVNPAAAEEHSWHGKMVLWEGDKMRIEFFGCTAGDDISGRMVGYIMTVPD